MRLRASSLQGATAMLATEITRLLTAPPSDPEDARGLYRVEVEIPDLNPLAWLEAQKNCTRYYWSDRDENREMAGIGEADALAPSGPPDLAALFKHMRNQLSHRWTGLRYYGGFRFHTGDATTERWRNFREFRFVVPRFEVIRSGDTAILACNIKIRHPRTNELTLKTLQGDLETMRFDSQPPPGSLPPITGRSDLPDRRGWYAVVNKALDEMETGSLEKVVLARETVLTAGSALDPVLLLRRLLLHTQRSFEFCFHPADDRAFIGASPELLYRRTNCFLESEAIAGTAPRGATDARDRKLAALLLGSNKDLREHALVVAMLEKQFGRFCSEYKRENQPRLLKLRNCHHLRTRFEGILEDDNVDAELIQALHPTPAVGGTPRSEALRFISENETFDRGIYASPVGWVGWDAAAFSVAIRSGLVRENEIAIYSGAGIVAGSDAGDEWDEIETKMKNFLHALDDNGSS